MKTQLGLYFTPGTADALRERAVKVAAPLSDLAEMCVRFGLRQLTDDQIAEWMKSQAPNVRGRLAGGLRQTERACMAALEDLRKAEPGAYRFAGTTIANKSGLGFAVAYRALQSLRTRGLVTGTELEPVDRWGRSEKSLWSLAAPKK